MTEARSFYNRTFLQNDLALAWKRLGHGLFHSMAHSIIGHLHNPTDISENCVARHLVMSYDTTNKCD
jgi:hypothetical protein